ncbi:sensor domain-containing diguanylate cyclase [Agaribacterium haliotis]|uniref:sensor domain-containing diguanylate cyclase n=1 Tax=Agaribacterium haliotis TaxID=2013869 RepID=UPI000BB563AF|nr:diguanylate cyclase [Agaribacterium haliotis]
MPRFKQDPDTALVQNLLNATPVAALLVNEELRISFCNKRAASSLAWTQDELEGQSILNIIPERFHERHAEHTLAYMANPRPLGMKFDRNVLAKNKSGTELPVEVSVHPIALKSGNYLLVSMLDVSDKLRAEAVEALNERLYESASIDSLTGLPNRSAILSVLAKAISEQRRKNDGLTVAFLDLDGFKAVNDELGHAAGDEVLKRVAQVLQQHGRRSDAVGRLGGDEFLLIFQGLGDEAGVRKVGESLLRSIETINQCRGERIHIGASIGALSLDVDAKLSPEQAVQIADELMYDAKRHGKARLEYLHYSGDCQPC